MLNVVRKIAIEKAFGRCIGVAAVRKLVNCFEDDIRRATILWRQADCNSSIWNEEGVEAVAIDVSASWDGDRCIKCVNDLFC